MLVFENNIDTDSSFNTMFHADGGKVFIQAYATSGIVANTPMLVQFMGSGYNATLISACTSEAGFGGYPKDGKALASGCVGWVQVRGKIEDVQAFVATGFTGSVGHSVFMGATATAGGFGATSSANVGNGAIGQIGVLLEAASGSLTTTMYLTGVYSAVLNLAP